MAKGTRVANAIVTVIPSMEGMRTTLDKEIPKAVGKASTTAGKEGGQKLSDSLGKQFSKTNIGSKITETLKTSLSKGSTSAVSGAKSIFTSLENTIPEIVGKAAGEGGKEGSKKLVDNLKAGISDVETSLGPKVGDVLKNSVTGALDSLDGVLGGTLRDKLDTAFGSAVESLRNVGDALSGVLPTILGEAANAAGSLAGSQLGSSILTGFNTFKGILSTAIGERLTSAIKSAGNVIGDVKDALGTKIGDRIKSAIEGASSIFASAKDTLASALSTTMGDAADKAGNDTGIKLGQAIQKSLKTVDEIVTLDDGAIKSLREQLHKGCELAATDAGKTLAKALPEAVDSAAVASGKSGGEQLVQSMDESVVENSKTMTQTIKSVFSSAINGAVKVINFGSELKTKFSDAMKAASSVIDSAKSTVSGAFSRVMSTAASAAGKVMENKLVQTVKAAFSGIASLGSTLGSGLINAVKTGANIVGTAKGVLSNALSKVVNAASTVAGKLGGESLGESLSSGFSTMQLAIGNVIGNVLTSAIQSAAGAAKEAFSQAFQGYADFQQLEGGVETLFKDSAGIVKENAKNAFETAGMSANEYMETVTNFSASLISSLGGDTEKAAALSDQALKDMSDNANKMGTDLGRISDAYGGFSRGNFTMLDNLKLGFGGTKEEAQRLLDTAANLKAEQGEYVEYSIDSFSDMIEAIHVVQDNMGITGTTAEEAGTTISGSMNMAKKSWDDFLTGLANPDADMGQLSQNLVKSLGIAFENIKPAITQMFAGAFEGTLDVFDGLGLTAASDFLRGIRDGLASEGVQQALESVSTFAGIIADKLGQVFGQVNGETASGAIENVAGAVKWLADMLIQAWPLVERLIDDIGGLVTGVFDAFWKALESPSGQKALASVSQLLGDVANDINWLFHQNAPDEEGMTGFFGTLFDLISSVTDALDWILPIVSSVFNIIIQVGGAAFEAISEIFQGIGEAIGSIAGAMSDETLDGRMMFTEITSGDIIEGLKNIIGFLKDGVLAALQWVKDNGPAIAEVILGIVDGLSNAFSTAQEVLTNVFTFIGDRIAELVDFFTNDPLGQEIVATVVDIASTIGGIIGTIVDYIGWLSETFQKFLGETDENGVSTFDKIAKAVYDAFRIIAELIEGLLKQIDGALTFIKGVFEVVFGLVKGIVTGDFSEMATGVEDIMKGAGKVIEGIWDAVCATIGKFFEGLLGVVKGIFDDIVGFIAGIPGEIAKMFSNIKLPQIELVGDWNFDPMNFHIPEIKFMAKGGFLNRETVIAGEAGPELYWPGYDPYFDKYAAGIAKHLDGKTGGDTYIIVDGAVVNSTEEMKTSFYDNMMELKRLGVMSSGYAR